MLLIRRGDMLLLLDSESVLSRYVFRWPHNPSDEPASGPSEDGGWFAKLFGTGGTQPSHWVNVTEAGSPVVCYQVSALRVTCPTFATACAIVPASRDPSRQKSRPKPVHSAPSRSLAPFRETGAGLVQEGGGVVSAAISLLHFASGDLVVVAAEPRGLASVELLLDGVMEFWLGTCADAYALITRADPAIAPVPSTVVPTGTHRMYHTLLPL